MQHHLNSLIGFAIRATDGDLGKVREFYFDDATWTIRYMVADTGNWLSGRRVLISLAALGTPDWESRTFPVDLTRAQVQGSPDIDTDRPVFRQHEVSLHEYYRWSPYWSGGYAGAFGQTPPLLFDNPALQIMPEPEKHDDPHLRSSRQITGYRIHANDGQIGHVKDFIVDIGNWTLTHLLVDTGNWLPGRKTLISPKWIRSMDWADGSVNLDCSRESVKDSPEFDLSKTGVRDFEESVFHAARKAVHGPLYRG